MKAQDFEAVTPPWVDIGRWHKWVESHGVSIVYGDRHNRTDGEVHYILRHKKLEFNMNANYWDWHSGWQEAIDWVESVAPNKILQDCIERP